MQLSEQQKNSLDKAIAAIQDRNFYAHHPEHPGAYGEEAANNGKTPSNNNSTNHLHNYYKHKQHNKQHMKHHPTHNKN